MKPAQKIFPNFQRGQGLIEIIVAIGIGTILILALVSLSTRATRNSDVSRNQAQATRLASEGLEVIRSLKSNNGESSSGCDGDPDRCLVQLQDTCEEGVGFSSFINWQSFFSTNVADEYLCGEYGLEGYLHYKVSLSVGQKILGGDDINNDCLPWCAHFTPDGDVWGEVTIGNRTFSRKIYVADTSRLSGGKSDCNKVSGDHTQIKQFTVVLTWTDVAGPHEIVNSSCMTR